jgi:hypothetical protein
MTTTHEDRAGASRDCRSAQIKARLAKSLEMAQMKMPCMASDRTGTSITARNPTPSTSSASSSKKRADIALLAAVAEAIGDRQFTSAQLMAHATVHPALHEALEAADITNAHELGCVFRRMEGIAVTGFRLERAGVVWQVRVCEILPRIVAAANTRDHEHRHP